MFAVRRKAVPLSHELAPQAGAEGTPPADRRSRLTVFVVVDALAITLGSGAAMLGSDLTGGSDAIRWVVAFDVLVFLGLTRRGFYRVGIGASLLDEMARLVGVTATVASAIIVLRVLVVSESDVGGQGMRLWGFVTVYLAVGRLGLALQLRRRRRVGGALRTLIVGAGHVGGLVGARLLENRQIGLLPIGFLDDEPLPDKIDRLGPPLLGTTADLEALVSAHKIAHVVICFSSVTHEVLLDVARRARRMGVGVSLVPRLYEEVTTRVAVGHIGGIPLLQVDQADPRGWPFAMKYALDRIVAMFALVLLAPLMLLVAVAVKASSPGPTFYRQRRVGLDGREFEILKFRTMRDEPASAEEPDETVAVAMLRQESPLVSGDRRTPIGAWLRRLSLDELPQIINVARGDMALVGPRPERPSLAENFQRKVYRYGDRHRVKSGMTGWAQVHGLRGQSSLSDRAEWDNYYIENWSFWLDLKILLLTIPALFRGSNDS